MTLQNQTLPARGLTLALMLAAALVATGFPGAAGAGVPIRDQPMAGFPAAEPVGAAGASCAGPGWCGDGCTRSGTLKFLSIRGVEESGESKPGRRAGRWRQAPLRAL